MGDKLSGQLNEAVGNTDDRTSSVVCLISGPDSLDTKSRGNVVDDDNQAATCLGIMK